MSGYSNAGLSAPAALFIGAHGRAAQYLDQAPVLVMFARLYAGHPAAVQWRIASLCDRGVSLKEFMRALDLAPPLRRLHASVLQPSQAGLLTVLSHQVPAAVLGRVIPETAQRQRRWLRHLRIWIDHRLDGSRQRAALVWATEHLADVTRVLAGDLRDFHLSGAPFNPAWGLKRTIEEMNSWHTRITLRSQLARLPVGADDIIDLGGHPDETEIDRYVLTALRTPRQIAEEGSAMRHCVATYLKGVFDGRSHIISITRNGERVATLDAGRLFQVRGPCNAEVSPVVRSLARFYTELHADAGRRRREVGAAGA